MLQNLLGLVELRLMRPTVRDLRLYLNTVRHLRPVQVVGRLYGEGKRALGLVRAPDPPARLMPPSSPFAAAPLRHRNGGAIESVMQGEFSFLGATRDLGWPIDWRAEDMPLLWQFNLHYAHYLDGLGPEEQATLMQSWIAGNPVGQGVGWHPYPTALRIINWCGAEPSVLSQPDVAFSLYQQAGYLWRGMEFYHPGNHLIENARALVLVGAAFGEQGEAPRWRAHGLSVLRRETPEQVLSDGGYFERSPMYHVLMTEAYLDVLNTLPPNHSDRPWVEETVKRMVSALQTMCHPDGEVALFNDAALGVSPPPATVLDYAARLLGRVPEAAAQLETTGLYRYEGGSFCLLVDGGPIGPDHLPAHAHADMFTYELSVGGLRFVTDTGVSEYAGPHRAYERSTAAHNTLEVDGTDHAECWGSFRVARRYPPRSVSAAGGSKEWVFEGSFDGYASLLGDNLAIKRRVHASPETIEVVDEVSGHGDHEAVSRIHLHPAVSVTEVGPRRLRLEREGHAVTLDVGEGTLTQTTTYYAERFGVRHPRTTLALHRKDSPPYDLRYTFGVSTLSD
ncbi:MAG: heparinase II/III family protein [Rubricoccaceae bacterium]